MAATITSGKTFTAGETVTAADLNSMFSSSTIANIANSELAGSIEASKLTAGAMNMTSYQVGGTEVLDASRNLTNIAAATLSGALTCAGFTSSSNSSVAATLTVNSLTVNAALGTTNLHTAAVNLGADSGDTVNLNGTLEGSPTLTAATSDFAADAILGLDGSTTNGPIKAFPKSAFQPKVKIAVLEDQKASGTSGGTTPNPAAWTKRDLNTEVSDGDSIVTLAPDQFTPIAGTYLVQVESSFYNTDGTGLRVRNVTTGPATALVGLTNYVNETHTATVVGVLTANGTDAFEIQYYCAGTTRVNGLGSPATTGEAEVFTRVTLTKIA